MIVVFLLTGCAHREVDRGSAAAALRPPNIIFILADDLGYGDLGCYGQRQIRTPHVDRLAAQGLRFTQCYAGATVCAPSRAVLMTGLHTGHVRVRGNASGTNAMAQSLRAEDLTVARLLQDAGYATGLVGKWGLGDASVAEPGLPRRQGFDEFFGYLNQRHAHNYYPTFLWHNETRVPTGNLVPNESPDGAGVSSNRAEYAPDRITDEAVKFIRRHRARPFFLCYTPTLPHANNEAGAHGLEVPDLDGYENQPWTPAQQAYAAMVTRLDRDVGRIMATLQELGLDRETIVFFSSDNGPHREGGHTPIFHRSSGPLRGLKRDLYEGGIRVPMIVRWPGRITAGTSSDQVWAFWDFLPTAAELAGARTPEKIDGTSMLPTLLGQRQPQPHAFLYWEFHEGGFQQAIRAGPWKAVRPAARAALELYHLPSDIGETWNLAARHPARVARLERLLEKARVDSTDWPVQR